jgi:hypothetical protein
VDPFRLGRLSHKTATKTRWIRRPLHLDIAFECNQLLIWVGAVKDWERAFYGFEPTLDYGPHVLTEYKFGLRYLFDGFLTDEDLEREWEQRVEQKRLVGSTLKQSTITRSLLNQYMMILN